MKLNSNFKNLCRNFNGINKLFNTSGYSFKSLNRAFNNKIYHSVMKIKFNFHHKYNFSTNNPKNEKNDSFSKNSKEENNKEEEDEDINYKSKRSIYILSATSVVILCIYYSIQMIQKQKKVEQVCRMGKVTYVGKAKIGAPWELTDYNGNTFGSYNLRGKYYLIYFGFTKCPDVCPASMSKLARVIKELKTSPESKYFDIEAVFVSCDPDRDSLEVIKRYCTLFDESIIGVTGKNGEDENLKKMLKDFKIHSSKIYMNEQEEKENYTLFKQNMERSVGKEDLSFYNNKAVPSISNNEGNYSLDHTIVTYLFGQNNNFLTYLSSSMSAGEMKEICLNEIMNDVSEVTRNNK